MKINQKQQSHIKSMLVYTDFGQNVLNSSKLLTFMFRTAFHLPSRNECVSCKYFDTWLLRAKIKSKTKTRKKEKLEINKRHILSLFNSLLFHLWFLLFVDVVISCS